VKGRKDRRRERREIINDKCKVVRGVWEESMKGEYRGRG
jgi:hypothetical protein